MRERLLVAGERTAEWEVNGQMEARILGMSVAVLWVLATSAAAQTVHGPRVQEQFERYCAPCHGLSGAGDGELGPTLRQQPRDFTNCADMAKSSDDELFNGIKNGGDSVDGEQSDMPAMRKSFSDEEIRALVMHVRQFCLPKGEYSDARQRESGMRK
jgi:cytochrome c553